MAYKDLRDFINVLEKRDLLKRIKSEVDPILEISEITDRVCKSPGGGKALFFEKVKGSQYPVVTNIFGSFERITLSLEIEALDDVGKRIEDLLHQAPPKRLIEKLA
ncbi:MAG: menaquinone biosynthesis decarboxylase, partial [Thermodesulfovibrionales bacterium]